MEHLQEGSLCVEKKWVATPGAMRSAAALDASARAVETMATRASIVVLEELGEWVES